MLVILTFHRRSAGNYAEARKGMKICKCKTREGGGL